MNLHFFSQNSSFSCSKFRLYHLTVPFLTFGFIKKTLKTFFKQPQNLLHRLFRYVKPLLYEALESWKVLLHHGNPRFLCCTICNIIPNVHQSAQIELFSLCNLLLICTAIVRVRNRNSFPVSKTIVD